MIHSEQGERAEGGRRARVAVFGGGVAGLSVAHELAETGRFDVTVFEGRALGGAPEFGGKARSFRNDAGFAGEHGFRFFPGFYRHVTGMMARIPVGSDERGDGQKTVADHLVPVASSGFYAQADGLAGQIPPNWFTRLAAKDALLGTIALVLTAVVSEMRPGSAGWTGWAASVLVLTLAVGLIDYAARTPNAMLLVEVPRAAVRQPRARMVRWLLASRAGRLARLGAAAGVVLWSCSVPMTLGARLVLVIFALIVAFLRVVGMLHWMWARRSEIPHAVRPRLIESLVAFLSVARIVTSCRSRLYDDYEQRSWWDYIGAPRYSGRYQLAYAKGLTRTFVATRAEEMSARTGGRILAELLYDINPFVARRPGPADRVLDGPTSEVWIEPWVAHLRTLGVRFNALARSDGGCDEHASVFVHRLYLDGVGEVNGFGCALDDEPGSVIVKGAFDHYVVALSGTGAQQLFANSPEVVEADQAAAVRPTHPLAIPGPAGTVPPLSGLFSLEFGWMNGIVYHLDRREDFPVLDALPEGHLLCLESEWALTAVVQSRHWSAEARGAGRVLSVNVSDWFRPSARGMPARFGNLDEVSREVVRQLRRHIPELEEVEFPHPGDPDVAARWRVLVDPALADETAAPGSGGPVAPPLVRPNGRRSPAPGTTTRLGLLENLPLLNDERLLINTVGSWMNRPCASTAVPNLLLAGDYIRSHTDFASMEAACEAARWAAVAICGREGVRPSGALADAERELVPFRVPAEIRPMVAGLRALDRVAHRVHLPQVLGAAIVPLALVARLEDDLRTALERHLCRPRRAATAGVGRPAAGSATVGRAVPGRTLPGRALPGPVLPGTEAIDLRGDAGQSEPARAGGDLVGESVGD